MSETIDFDSPETIFVDSPRVSCDGGGGALGHPIVYYEMGDDEMVVCKYCDRCYILRGGRHDPNA